MKTGTDLINEAKTRIRELTPRESMAALTAASNTVLIDVREPNEFNLGHAAGAIHVPRGLLEGSIEAAVSRDKPVIIYCASGNRSALAADTMQQMGYTNVASMSGGFRGWVESGGDVEG